MTNSFKSYAILSIGLLAMGGAAYGAQPPDVVQSDVNKNTAMGTAALQSLTTGIYNTAAGYAALSSNTTGDENTAYMVEADVIDCMVSLPGQLFYSTQIPAKERPSFA